MFFSAFCGVTLATWLPSAGAPPVSFEPVQAIFAQHCHGCHGAEKQSGGLRLDTRSGALHGGDSGAVIRPGEAGESLLFRYVSGLDPERVMPPKGERLTDEQIMLLRQWIDAGASWPDAVDGEARRVSRHWAFRKPDRTEAPAVERSEWVRNPIDAFVLRRLERENLAPSREADRATLIRRLSLDLLGLPPAREEIEAFVHDPRKDAYEKLVERLLGSPHFGERWGRHWLDLARYADSDGYEKDTARPYAYLYRDWVIDAINRDLPFDQFSREQLAGDLLPEATLEQRTATGFHRNTLKNLEGGVHQEEFRTKATVDRVNTTGTVWLGLTLGCAECHTHKYDPVTQREYFELYAFFNNLAEVDLPAPQPAELAEYLRSKEAWESEQARLEGAIEAAASDEAEARKIKERIEAHAKAAPKPPATRAPALSEHHPPRETRIHIRGDFLRPGDSVEPGTPSVLHPMVPRNGKPTRLDLVDWLFDAENPLTARVAVNQVWHHLFGRGLVATLDDFGTRGEEPSHPELLDWLAAEWPRLGWSRKALIRLIVTSSTYRQSSETRPELAGRDPLNVLLARQNRFRLDAEAIRDVHLRVSGLLQPAIGGPSVRPPLPADIAAIGYANSVRWRESEGGDKYRRGLYIFFQRTVPYPMLITFDGPDSNVTCTRRERSNTPLQALTLLNDPVFFECARALGRRMAAHAADTAGRLRFGFEACVARPPTDAELERIERLHADQLGLLRRHPENARVIAGAVEGSTDRAVETAAMVAVARTLLNLDEFLNRE